MKTGNGEIGSKGEVGGVEDAERGCSGGVAGDNEFGTLVTRDDSPDVADEAADEGVSDSRALGRICCDSDEDSDGAVVVTSEVRVELGEIILLSLRARGPAGRLRGGLKPDVEDME